MMAIFQSLPAIFFETVGVVGFALYVLNYSLLTLQKLSSHSHIYFVMNLFAASFVLVGLSQSFNLAAALIQLFWIVISVIAIVLRLRGRRAGGVARDVPRKVSGLTPNL